MEETPHHRGSLVLTWIFSLAVHMAAFWALSAIAVNPEVPEEEYIDIDDIVELAPAPASAPEPVVSPPQPEPEPPKPEPEPEPPKPEPEPEPVPEPVPEPEPPKPEPPKPEPPKPEPPKPEPKETKIKSLQERLKNAKVIKTETPKPQPTPPPKTPTRSAADLSKQFTKGIPSDKPASSSSSLTRSRQRDAGDYAERYAKPVLYDHWTPPNKAQLNGQRPSSVVIRLTVSADGRITNISISQTSNSELMNRSVQTLIAAIQQNGIRLEPFSKAGVQDTFLTLTVTMKLQD